MHVLNPLRILPLVSRRVEDLRFACLWSAELVPWCCWLRVGLEIRLEVEVEDRMAHHHFVLIHGGCHGAWAWCKLEDRLQRKGCKVTALDMTGAGIHPADPDSITTYEEYHQPALIFFESVPEGNLDKVKISSLAARLFCVYACRQLCKNVDVVFKWSAASGVPMTEDTILMELVCLVQFFLKLIN